MTSIASTPVAHRSLLERMNTDKHDVALSIYMLVVIAHWAEHVAQAIQIYGLGMAPKEARGVLGMPFPWLITSEWLHYGYALFMLSGLWFLRKGFVGRARQWWMLAFGIQFWHHIEHFLLLIQSWSGWHLDGKPVPTSIIQLIVPRVELHLFYNGIVFIPMLIAVILHRHASAADRARMHCPCAFEPRRFDVSDATASRPTEADDRVEARTPTAST